MCLPVSSALRGYLNLTLRFCGAADPQLKKSGVAVLSQSQSQKSENLGGDGTVYNKNQCNNKSE